jgi:hypothetical protein
MDKSGESSKLWRKVIAHDVKECGSSKDKKHATKHAKGIWAAVMATQLDWLPPGSRRDAEKYCNRILGKKIRSGVITTAQAKNADPKDVQFNPEMRTALEAHIALMDINDAESDEELATVAHA